MDVPSPVLAAFAPPVSHWMPVGGGFSRAVVFRGSDAAGPLVALKGYPPGTPADRVRLIHARMSAANRPFVPRLFPTRSGSTTIEAAGRVWELAAWMPGEPLTPTPARLFAAGETLSQLHRGWRRTSPMVVPFPAVERRLSVLRDWRSIPAPRPPDPTLAELVREAAARLPALADAAERRLAPLRQLVPVQPVLGDVHPAHVLLTGDAVTGIIDFASTRADHISADLARLLTDFPDLDPAPLLAGYGESVSPDLVRTLADTGRVGSLAGWMLRLAHDPTAGGRPIAVADRLQILMNGDCPAKTAGHP